MGITATVLHIRSQTSMSDAGIQLVIPDDISEERPAAAVLKPVQENGNIRQVAGSAPALLQEQNEHLIPQLKPTPAPEKRRISSSPNIDLKYEIGPPTTNSDHPVRTFASAEPEILTVPKILPVAAAALATSETPIVFNFENAPWNLVLQQFCERAGMALEMKAQPPTLFTYRDEQPHTVNEGLDILNGFLIRDGFILVRHGRLMLLVTIDSIPQHLIDSLPIEELKTRSRFELVSVEIKVDEVSVVEMSQQLQPLLSPLGKIIPLTSAYRLVITDLRERVEEVLKFIRMANLESAEVVSEVVQLRNLSAEEVVKSLQQTMGNQVAVATAGKPASSRSSGGSPVVSVVESNALVIKGRPLELERIRGVIAALDQSPAQVHIQCLLVEVELS
ncbi:MAG: hypothetical protein MK102_18710, partial [Fuerstiella sp.]|nr:hypothetical protein [Fuerstiella sp.]